jgi:hypothetical protein
MRGFGTDGMIDETMSEIQFIEKHGVRRIFSGKVLDVFIGRMWINSFEKKLMHI